MLFHVKNVISSYATLQKGISMFIENGLHDDEKHRVRDQW